MIAVFGEAPRQVLQEYEIEELEQVTKHRSICFLTTRTGEKVFKPSRAGSARTYLTGELLKNRENCVIIPALIQTKNARNYCWFSGNRYQLTTRLPGQEADYRRLEDLQAAVRSMRIFHHFTSALIGKNSSKWNLLNFPTETEWRKRFQELEICRKISEKRRDYWSERYRKAWRYFNDLAFQALKKMAGIGNKPEKVICYHDWAHHNLILDNGLAYLVDFDYMIIDRAAHDKANLALKYLRLSQWTVESLFRVLWTFDRYYSWSFEELKLFRIYLTFPYDFWMLGRQYFLEKQPWSQRYFEDQWQRKIVPFRQFNKLLKILESLE